MKMITVIPRYVGLLETPYPGLVAVFRQGCLLQAQDAARATTALLFHFWQTEDSSIGSLERHCPIPGEDRHPDRSRDDFRAETQAANKHTQVPSL